MKRFVFRHPRFVLLSVLVVLLALSAGTSYLQLQRPIPKPQLVETKSFESDPPPSAEIAWPSLGEAGVAIAGTGVIGESPAQEPQPIASLAKVMTAHVILKHHPLTTGEPGPEVTFDDADEQDYLARRANGESVVAVKSGAKMTERDLLRGLLLASGNNLGDVLAKWDSGSVDAFVDAMNSEAKSLGMTQTVYADPAGLLPKSLSTAHDQILLASAAMSDKTFASVVREEQASLPGAGVVFNTNSQLGSSGIVGIKTGWTEYAGACFLFASEEKLQDRTITIVGAVLGQNTLADAFARSRELIAIAQESVQLVKIGSAGDVVGQIKSKWGETSNAVLESDASMILLPGMEVSSTLNLTDSPIKAGEDVGSARFAGGSQVVEIPVKAADSIGSPGLLWRLQRIR